MHVICLLSRKHEYQYGVPNHSRAVALASGEEEIPWCKITGSYSNSAKDASLLSCDLGKQFMTLQRTVVHSKHFNYSPNDKAPLSVGLEFSTFLAFTLRARWNTIPLSFAHDSTFCILSSLEIGCSIRECLNHQGPFLGFVKDHIHIIVSARVCN